MTKEEIKQFQDLRGKAIRTALEYAEREMIQDNIFADEIRVEINNPRFFTAYYYWEDEVFRDPKQTIIRNFDIENLIGIEDPYE